MGARCRREIGLNVGNVCLQNWMNPTCSLDRALLRCPDAVADWKPCYERSDTTGCSHLVNKWSSCYYHAMVRLLVVVKRRVLCQDRGWTIGGDIPKWWLAQPLPRKMADATANCL